MNSGGSLDTGSLVIYSAGAAKVYGSVNVTGTTTIADSSKVGGSLKLNE